MSEIPLYKKYSRLAKEKEVIFNWIEAAELYQMVVSNFLTNKEYIKAGETQERQAYCRYRAAYQSDTSEEFKALLESTSQDYGRASEIYEMLRGPNREARILTNQVMKHFYRSWLIEDPSDRKTKVAQCVEEFKVALHTCEDSEDNARYGKVCNDFLSILYALSELAFTYEESLEIIETSLEYGAQALQALKKDERGLARCYYLLSLFLPDRAMDVVESTERQRELLQLGLDYANRAVTLAEKLGDKYLIAFSQGILSYYLCEVSGEIEKAVELATKELENGTELEDKLVLARSNEYLSYYIDILSGLDEDRDFVSSSANKAMAHAVEAIKSYEILLHPILISYLARSNGPFTLASLETDRELKIKKIIASIGASETDLRYAVKSGSKLGQMYICLLLGASYLNYAKLERDQDIKDELLNESLIYRENYIELALQAQPYRYWNIAGAYLDLADLKAHLAERENDLKRQSELLDEVAEDIEKSIDLFNQFFKVYDIASYRDNYAIAEYRFGEIFFQIFLSSNEEEYLGKAIEHFKNSIESFKRQNMPGNIAELLWKTAWAYYRTQEFQRSAIEFDSTSRYYHLAGEKYPNHKDFYVGYRDYMEAWGNIARAMDYHSRDEYFLEKEYFEKAVHTLMSSDRWRYLGPNYQAWAKLAEAESQSRNDQCEKAIALFKDTSNLFSSAYKSIEDKLDSIGDRDEADMAFELKTASILRIEYCNGRVALEEAKLLDRKGEHIASSRRYGDAAQIFYKIVEAMQTEPERQEIKPLYSLCRAWQKMTQAEAKASPDLYLDASVLFDDAREHSPNVKTRLLTMGHASFCRALSAGIQYEVSREESLHQELVRHIGSATDFYVRAGFDSALEYSRATQRLFEAYQYMDRARGETEPGDKTKYYMMAEKLLGVSADAFQRAKHPEKRDEVARLLHSLKQDREIAVSLSEILDTPLISSSTESFRVPTPSHEYPVGLESFEHADIQAKIFLTSDTITTGEEFDLELELYNPGKTSASLMRVERLIPDDFEVSKVSGFYSFEEETLDLRGKRIGPLSTIEISLKAKPLSKGEYMLEPRIIFLDDTGEQRFSEPEPANIVVREMGILSWLRGTRPSF